MELSTRKKQILKVVVENYIETAEPVGSKVIAAQMEGSSARITDLFVDETVRRSKIGGQLLDKLLEEL